VSDATLTQRGRRNPAYLPHVEQEVYREGAISGARDSVPSHYGITLAKEGAIRDHIGSGRHTQSIGPSISVDLPNWQMKEGASPGPRYSSNMEGTMGRSHLPRQATQYTVLVRKERPSQPPGWPWRLPSTDSQYHNRARSVHESHHKYKGRLGFALWLGGLHYVAGSPKLSDTPFPPYHGLEQMHC
jgi:hypothetical protein